MGLADELLANRRLAAAGLAVAAAAMVLLALWAPGGLGLGGQIMLQLCRAAGLKVIGLDLEEAKLDLARKNGVLIAAQPDDPGLDTKVAAATVIKMITRCSGRIPMLRCMFMPTPATSVVFPPAIADRSSPCSTK